MKTLETLYEEVMKSETLKKEFLEAAKAKETVEAFVKNHGSDASLEELQVFMKEKAMLTISDEEVDSVAGGKASPGETVVLSIFTWGTTCAGEAIESEINKKYYGTDPGGGTFG